MNHWPYSKKSFRGHMLKKFDALEKQLTGALGQVRELRKDLELLDLTTWEFTNATLQRYQAQRVQTEMTDED